MLNCIHYIWLGGKKKPRVIRKCIKSWKKFFPGWEIKEWNETNLDLDMCEFVREAYDKKKYAFAADVFRFEILYKYGGLYFDTDVKVIKSFDDIINECDAFVGYEYRMAAPGLVLYESKPFDPIIKKVLDYYKIQKFIVDGNINTKVVGEYFSEVLEEYGFKYENKFQQCGNMTVYPNTYFCPYDGYGNPVNMSSETRSIHLYAASWMPAKYRFIVKIKSIIYNIFGLDLIQSFMNCVRKRNSNEN